MIKSIVCNWGYAYNYFTSGEFSIACIIIKKILTYKIPFANYSPIHKVQLTWVYGISLYNLGNYSKAKKVLDELPLEECFKHDCVGYITLWFVKDILYLKNKELRIKYLKKALANYRINKLLPEDLLKQFETEKKVIGLLIKSESDDLNPTYLDVFFKDILHINPSELLIELLKRISNRTEIPNVVNYLNRYIEADWAKELLNPSINVLSIEQFIKSNEHSFNKSNILTIKEVWLSELDIKLCQLGEEFAEKYYWVLFSNHMEVMMTIPTIQIRLNNITDIFYQQLRCLKFVIEFIEISPKNPNTYYPIEKQLAKTLSNNLISSKKYSHNVYRQTYFNDYAILNRRNNDLAFRKKLKLYYKDIRNIVISYIMFETGGYVDKLTAKKMKWISK